MSKCMSSAKNSKGFNRLKPLPILSEPDWIFLASLGWIIYDDPNTPASPYPRPYNALRAFRLFHCQALASKLASPSNKKADTTSL